MLSVSDGSSTSGSGSRPRSRRAFSRASSCAIESCCSCQLRPPPLDRVAERACEQHAGGGALDQVVLRAGGDRLHSAALVVEAGEHEHGESRRQRAQLAQPVEPLRVGQVEVEQHAVVAREPGADRAGERGCAVELHLRAGVGQLLLDDQRVAVVVLDQQDSHRVESDKGARGLEVQRTVHSDS